MIYKIHDVVYILIHLFWAVLMLSCLLNCSNGLYFKALCSCLVGINLGFVVGELYYGRDY